MQMLSDDYQKYNVWITSHGLLMIFFMIMPAMVGGFGNYFVPLLIGAPDMAFPRMDNLSFWLLVPSLILLIGSGFVEGGAGSGWTLALTFYLRSWRTCSRHGYTFNAPRWSFIVLGAINFITTIFNRAPGMTLHKMPLFAWSILITAFFFYSRYLF